MEVKKLKRIYTLFIAASPIVSMYASGIPGFTLGDILLVFFFALRIIEGIYYNNFKIRKNVAPIIPLIVAIPVTTLISVLFQSNVDTYSIVIRITRRMFYYLSVVIVSSEWFDYEYGKKCIVFLGKVGTIFLVIQYIAYYAGHIVLHGFLPFLPVYHEYYAQASYQAVVNLAIFRPTAFLLEPAHIARYFAISLIILLFDNQNTKEWKWTFFITAAQIMSTSGIGIIAAALIWLIWIVIGMLKTVHNKRIQYYYLLIYFAIIIGSMLVARDKSIQAAIYRITNSNLLDVNTAGGARFRGYVQYALLDTWGKIVGMGYGNTPNTELVTWFSGASYMLYGTGIVGFLVCINMYLLLLERNKLLVARILCLLSLFLFFVDDSFMSHYSVVLFSFICCAQRTEQNDDQVTVARAISA